MLSRAETREYALELCIPLLQRTLNRSVRSQTAFKPDQVGFIPAYLENLCRPFWGLAPVLSDTKMPLLKKDGNTVTIAEFLKDELIAGLSPDSDRRWDLNREYMGDYVYENQNITELAGLLIGMYFARDTLWDPIPGPERDIIANGIYSMAETAFDHSWPNNHYWFPLFAFTVLKRFGYTFARTEEMLKKGLDFLDSLYLGDGWYKDGAFGRFDYYEAWSLHLYPLLWTLIADVSFDGYAERRAEYVARTNLFLPFYTHWFDANGAQVPFGRSLSYRFAASALFPVAVLAGCDVDPVLAGRITRMNVEFFKKNYKTESGTILEEGYLYHSPATVERYTSDGGAYWCCKTFLALLIPESHPFWSDGDALLPAERGDYQVLPANKEIQLLFEGHRGLVTLYNNSAQYVKNGRLTHRFGDMRAWYGKFAYSSAAGFGCNSTDNVSSDSMISLMTKDETMASHRIGWKTFDMENGVLHSIHTPFSNDPDTTAETWIIPSGGYHIRIHRVRLAREYYISEGGFALGRWDDYEPVAKSEDGVSVSNKEYTSALRVAASVQVSTGVGITQSNYHLYAPLASYPVYKTGLLPAGVYYFAAAFGLWRAGEEETLPELEGFVEELISGREPAGK